MNSVKVPLSFIGDPNKHIGFIVYNHLFSRSIFNTDFTIPELIEELHTNYGIEITEDNKQEIINTVDEYIETGSISIRVGFYRFNMPA